MVSKDISIYLNPISNKNPVGENLRYTKTFDELIELRREDDQNVSYGIWESDLKSVNWKELSKKSHDILIKESKDLQILIWLIESWIVQNQFDGFVDGLELLNLFLNTFWDNFYPQSIENDFQHRISVLEYLDLIFAQQLSKCSLADNSVKKLDLNAWYYALHIENAKQRGYDVSDAFDNNKVDLDEFRNLLNTNKIEFINDLRAKIIKSEVILKNTVDFLDQKFKSDAPSFSMMKKVISNILNILNDEYKEKIEQQIKIVESPEVPSSKVSPEPKVELKNRDDIYRALEELIGYVKRMDPQSLTYSLLEIAIAWRDKSVLQVIAEIKSSDDPKYDIFRLLCNFLVYDNKNKI